MFNNNKPVSANQECTAISRKAFIAASLAVASGLITTNTAFADITGTPAGDSEGDEAKHLWEKAVKRAEAEGEFVSGFIPFTNSPIPRTSVKATSMTTTIKGVPTVVTASASLETNGQLVTKVNSAWITATAATVSNQGYRYTKADNGRTVCITYWCSITPLHKVPATCQFYAEFHSTGNGWMKGGPVS